MQRSGRLQSAAAWINSDAVLYCVIARVNVFVKTLALFKVLVRTVDLKIKL